MAGPLRRCHRRRHRTGGGRPVRHPPAGRPRRARHQDRAAGRRRFARGYDTTVKGLASWFVWLNRTKESLDARPQAAGNGQASSIDCSAAPTCSCRTSPPAPPIGSGSPPRRCAPAIPPDRLQYLRLRHDGPLRRQEGVQPHHPERGRHAVDHRHRGHAEQGRRLHRRHLGRHVHLFRHPHCAARPQATPARARSLDVALIDTLGEWMSYAAYYTEYSGTPPPRTGASHATIAPYGPYRTRDGAIVVAVHSNREWAEFCAARPAAAGARRRRALRDQRAARAAPRRARRGDRSGAARSCRRPRSCAGSRPRHIANANVNSDAEYLQHPQLTDRDCWREIESPAGPVRALVPPVRMEDVEPVMGAVPALGQHTQGASSKSWPSTARRSRAGRRAE